MPKLSQNWVHYNKERRRGLFSQTICIGVRQPRDVREGYPDENRRYMLNFLDDPNDFLNLSVVVDSSDER